MELSPNHGFSTTLRSGMWGYNSYTTPTGVKVYTKKGQGKVEVDEKDVVTISDANKVIVQGTKGDDKIVVKNSSIRHIGPDGGNNQTYLDNCTYKPYNRVWGSGTSIVTGASFRANKGSDIIKINGDFNGGILAQQGVGKGYGDDSKAHKDTILINGNNTGFINVDSNDKVMIKGKEKGAIVNQTTYFIPM